MSFLTQTPLETVLLVSELLEARGSRLTETEVAYLALHIARLVGDRQP